MTHVVWQVHLAGCEQAGASTAGAVPHVTLALWLVVLSASEPEKHMEASDKFSPPQIFI